jgi:hypothetical protein
MDDDQTLIPAERIERCILAIRGHRVMLDRDLAELYGVSTKVLNQAVKRNRRRFPEDFMFQLLPNEVEQLSRSQFVTLKRGHNFKYAPYAFTEQGVAMLSSVLKSDRAIDVNVGIMRAFVRLRQMLASNVELARKLGRRPRRSAVASGFDPAHSDARAAANRSNRNARIKFTCSFGRPAVRNSKTGRRPALRERIDHVFTLPPDGVRSSIGAMLPPPTRTNQELGHRDQSSDDDQQPAVLRQLRKGFDQLNADNRAKN